MLALRQTALKRPVLVVLAQDVSQREGLLLLHGAPTMNDGSVNLWWDVYCGCCGEYSEMFGPNLLSFPHSISKELRDLGWKRTRSDGWICPDCVKERRTNG